MDNQQVDIREDIKKLEMELKRIDSDKQGLDKERTGKVEQIKQLQIQVDQALQSKMMTINELSKLSAMKNAEKQSVAQMEVNKKTHEQKLKAAIQLKTQKTQERKTVNSELETLSKGQLDSYESTRASIMQSRDDLQLRMDNDQRTLNGLISSVQRDKAELARTKKLLDKAHADYKSFEVKAVDSEQKALNLSHGVQVKAEEVPTSKKEFEAELKLQKERAKKLQKDFGMNDQQLLQSTRELNAKINNMKLDNDVNVDYHNRLTTHWQEQGDTFQDWKESILRDVRMDFRTALSKNGILEGSLKVDYDNETLTIRASSSHSRTEVAMSSLSGGEKSKVLGCLLFALWNHVQCPFRGVDEWDVFLDHTARADMEDLMFSNVRKDDYQYFFISPQDSTMLTPQKIKETEKYALVRTLKKN